jgi:hypothetical protein
MPKKATRRRTRKQRRSKSRKGRGTRGSRRTNLTISHGRIRYRPRPGTTPHTFSTLMAQRMLHTQRAHRLSGVKLCKRMRVPRQHSANCWLNAAIMSLFVSNGMHRATAPIRHALINPPQTLAPTLRRELRQLGLAIHSVPLGILGEQYSTAKLIPALVAADRAGLTTPRNRLGAPQGTAHNPVWFFTALASLLLPLEYSIRHVDLSKPGGKPYPDLKTALAVGTHRNATHNSAPPHLLLIEAGQETADTKVRTELSNAITSSGTIRALGRRWRIDSIAMLDTTDSHFGGVITCNATPHTYDGITGSHVHDKRTWREVMDRLVNHPIPTPSREEFRYDVRTGYVVFAFVPIPSSSGRHR